MIIQPTALSARSPGYAIKAHGTSCACNVCARFVSQPAQTVPSVVPDSKQLQSNPLVQQAVASLPYAIDTKQVQSIFNLSLLKPVALNNPDLLECVDDLADILKEAKARGWKVEAFVNVKTSDFLVIVDKYGLGSTEERINLIKQQDDEVGRTISRDQEAVTDHEYLHEWFLRRNPYVQVNKNQRALKIVIGKSENEASVENSQWYAAGRPELMKRTYGITVYTQHQAFDEYENVEAQFQNSAQSYEQIKEQGFKVKDPQSGSFRNWSDLDFQSFIDGLKGLVNHLLAPLENRGVLAAAENLALAAVAPLALHGSIFQEHEKLSSEDQTRYAEATGLMENVKLLVNQINNFINRVAQEWNAWKQGVNPSLNALFVTAQSKKSS